MERREFIGWVGVAGVACSVSGVTTACSSQNTQSQSSASPPGADGFQAVGTVADLDKNGQILNEKFAAGKVLVVRDPNNTSQVLAVNPVCTHAGCDVAWKKDENSFVCPCHDSRFATDGKVLNGPADKPIPTYTAKVEGDEVLVKAG